MTNPARDNRARVMSAAIAAADESDVAYAQIKAKLAGHMRRLNLADESERPALLSALLPQYDAYISAEIAAATGRQNEVLLKLLTLKFLAGDVAGAMTIAEYAISSGMKYDGAESLAEYIAGNVVAQADAAGSAVLGRAVAATTGKVPQQVAVSLSKALSLVLIDERAGAL
ncbi:phage terminase small subunit [Undibacterium squillarum]|uniref:phage terminase small subunit n=1 Tax=Undibacterium squillarum TaxID=1131567 RepID=UPI0035AFF90B